jgi:hypothetical protein
MFQLLGKVVSFPLGYLPTGYINHKENRLDVYRTAQVRAMYPSGSRIAGAVAQRAELAPRPLLSRLAEVLYVDHMIQELKFVRLSTLNNPMNPLLNYLSETSLVVLNRDVLRLPITLLMLFKFHKEGWNRIRTNDGSYDKYRTHDDDCSTRGAKMHSAFSWNYDLVRGLLVWTRLAVFFTYLKFARDMHRISLRGHLLSTLASGVVYMTPQMFKTESTKSAANYLFKLWYSEMIIGVGETFYNVLLMGIVCYSLTTDSFVLARNMWERFRAKPTLDTDEAMLVALHKRCIMDKASLGKRVLNICVSISTCFAILRYEPIAFLTFQACHIGLVMYQNHYKFRMTAVRKETADFWSKFMNGVEGGFSLEEKRKLVEAIMAERVVLPSKKIQTYMEASVQGARTRNQRANAEDAIVGILEQKALRQFIKNATPAQVAQKVYEWILGHSRLEFFTAHFGFDAAWMNQVKDGNIPQEQAVLFIQDLLHLE